MRLAYVWRAKRVRDGNFSSMVVHRLNARERNIPSLAQRGLISGFLGRFGIHDTIMISGFILISISLSDKPESFISALQDILGRLRSTIKKPVTWEDRSEDSAKRGSKDTRRGCIYTTIGLGASHTSLAR
jgi:hypothetical protein